jgi:hypothetical protein
MRPRNGVKCECKAGGADFDQWLQMPKIQFGPLKDTSAVSRSVWWHVPVWLERRLPPPLPLDDVGARLVFRTPALGPRTLYWKPLHPGRPEACTTLRMDDEWR